MRQVNAAPTIPIPRQPANSRKAASTIRKPTAPATKAKRCRAHLEGSSEVRRTRSIAPTSTAAMLLVRRTSDDPSRWARQRFAFVAGAVGFLIVLAAFLELAGWRGMGIVGAAFTCLMVRWYRRAPSVAAPEPGSTVDPSRVHGTDPASASGLAR